AAWSLDSKTKEVVRWMGTARAPVLGSGAAPACSARVSKPGSAWPAMGRSPWVVLRFVVGYIGPSAVRAGDWQLPEENSHESQRHPARQRGHALHRLAQRAARCGGAGHGPVRHWFSRG